MKQSENLTKNYRNRRRSGAMLTSVLLVGCAGLLVATLVTADPTRPRPASPGALDETKLDRLVIHHEWARLMRELEVVEPAERGLPTYAYYRALGYFGTLWLAAGDLAARNCLDWMRLDGQSHERIETRNKRFARAREVAVLAITMAAKEGIDSGGLPKFPGHTLAYSGGKSRLREVQDALRKMGFDPQLQMNRMTEFEDALRERRFNPQLQKSRIKELELDINILKELAIERGGDGT